MYRQTDYSRFYTGESDKAYEFRSEFRRDFGRLLHSPAFRRLQGKTQLFPGNESDFFRNRLTHSLEVAQIAKGIALKLNKEHSIAIDLDLIEFAGMAHDLGHPPFGHQGEEALDECMREFGGFEGNAQTLRLLSKIEKKIIIPNGGIGGIDPYGNDIRAGLNLTARSLASVLKYNFPIPFTLEDRQKYANAHHFGEIIPVKGYYQSEESLVKWIKENVTDNPLKTFKTVECQIMDIADDIAYSTYDLEDSFKAGFLSPIEMVFAPEPLLDKIANKVNKRSSSNIKAKDIQKYLIEIFGIREYESLHPNPLDFSAVIYSISKSTASNGLFRTRLTSELVNDFIQGIQFKYDPDNPELSTVKLENTTKIKVEIIKNFTYECQIQSPRLKIVELRGKEIVKKLFESISQKPDLLPDDFRNIFDGLNSQNEKNRTICDYIAGMTDRYAIEFYGRLTSENPETIFKPL